jgi:hypothetical protein
MGVNITTTTFALLRGVFVVKIGKNGRRKFISQLGFELKEEKTSLNYKHFTQPSF